MSKTAMELTPEDLKKYNPLKTRVSHVMNDRRKEALFVAKKISDSLKINFNANQVILFGSLAHQGWFHQHSDIDLAVSGVQPEKFYEAVSVISGLSAEFEVDLVDLDSCALGLKKVIQQEGVVL